MTNTQLPALFNNTNLSSWDMQTDVTGTSSGTATYYVNNIDITANATSLSFPSTDVQLYDEKPHSVIYKNKIISFPSFKECEYKYHELRSKHSALSKWSNKSGQKEWHRLRSSKISKEMQILIGALSIYNGQMKGFTNRI